MTPAKAAPSLLLFIFFSCAMWLPTRSAAAEDMEWQFYEDADQGQKTASLIYGVPETDAFQVSGMCEAKPGGPFSILTFGADIGMLEANKEVELRFSGGGFDHAVKGKIHRDSGEEGLSGVAVELAGDDPLWGAMDEKESLDYLVPGYKAATLDFTRGRDKIKQFVQACRAYAAAPNGGQADAKATPSDSNAEKDAFDNAKELGTIEGWEAFIANYPSGFHADLARAYIKKLGAADAPSTAGAPPSNGVTGLNVTSVTYAKGTFVKNGPSSWVEQGENGSAIFRFKETSRNEREVLLFDPSRKVVISLSIATGAILYGPEGKPLAKLYDIVATAGGEVMTTAPVPAPKPAAKKATTKPGCRKGQIMVDGKCMSKQKAVGYCGPGYRPQGGKCVQGFVAPKPRPAPQPSQHGCKPGLVWSPQEGCHEDD
jgi:hypothetical protein